MRRSVSLCRGLVGLTSLATVVVWAQPAPAARWVQGSSVNLRASPSASAPVLRRLALNTRVQLHHAPPEGGFCKVAVEDASGAVEGYTACQYLGSAPLAMQTIGSRLLSDGAPNPAYDPVKAFEVEPSWGRLVDYAIFLTQARLSPEAQQDPKTPRPPDAALQRMKEHLAKGVYGPPAEPYVSWSAARATAEAHRLRLGHGEFDAASDPRGPERQLALAQSIELPTVMPSAFARDSDVAPPSETAPALSGRFRIVHTYRSRPRAASSDSPERAWDIAGYTVALTRPVHRVTLFRDGRTRSEATHASAAHDEYGDLDGPMCPGFVAGFEWGDAEPLFWQKAGEVEGAHPDSLKVRPAGSLFRLYTAQPLAGTSKLLATQRITLDRQKTGFVRAVHMHYDLDGDGVADLSVWEGTGRGPGHLDSVPDADQPYHRIAFVNIAGQWRLLGVDSFQYGCGC